MKFLVKEFEELSESIIEGDAEKAKDASEKILKKKIDPLKALNEVVWPAATIVGQKFEKYEIFLVELMNSAEATKNAVNILVSALPADKTVRRGKIVMATVKNDIHDIGKNIVSAMLMANGFEVHDLGVDVPVSRVVEKAAEVNADIIALSSLLTTSMEQQRELINLLKELRLRDKYLIMVGGGPVTKEWSDEISADGYAENASEAVRIASSLIEKRRGK